MRKLLSILFIAALWLMPIHGVGVAQRVVYKTYTNARYSYSISYPSHLLVPQGEADNGDGQAFRSRDGLTELRVYGSQDMGGGLEQAYREAQSGKSISYKTIRRDWFVVSGYHGGKIFYQKTMFRDDVLKTFTIEYDESRKSVYDAVTARIARSFIG